jgi:hypothetical protein
LPKSYHHVVANLDERMSLDQQSQFFHILSHAKKQINLYTHSKEFAVDRLNLITGNKQTIHEIQDQLGLRDKVLAQLDAYQKMSSVLAKAWVNYFNEKETEKNPNLNLSAISVMEKAQNELADNIVSSQLLTTDDLNTFRIDHVKIKKHAKKYQLHKIVDEYIKADNPICKGELANIMMANLSQYFANFKKLNLDSRGIQQDAYQHQKKLMVAKLSLVDRKRIATLDAYFQHSQGAREMWSKILASSTGKTNNHLKKVAYSITRLRNQASFEIFKDLNEYRHLFDRLILNTEKLIEKHAKQHEMFIEQNVRRKEAFKTKDWRHMVHFEREQKLLNSIKANNNNFIKPSKKIYLDKELILREIMRNPELILSSLLGKEPNRKLSKHHQIRWGQKGAIVLYTNGKKCGQVRDWESGIHGDIISYIAKRTGKDWYDVLHEFGTSFNLNSDNISFKKFELTPKQKELNDKALIKELKRQEKNHQIARELWRNAQPIKGTPAETYLKKYRKITGNFDKLELKFHPKAIDYHYDAKGKFQSIVNRPALLVAAKNMAGSVVSVQCIYLHPKSHDKDISLPVPKRTIGSSFGFAAKVYSGGGDEVILAEGPETAASLIEAKPNANIYISLGNPINMSKYAYLATIHRTNKILIASDNDDANSGSKTWESVQAAAIELAKTGIEVSIAKPVAKKLVKLNFLNDKPFDFNDILRSGGSKAVEYNLNPNYIVDHFEKDTLERTQVGNKSTWEVRSISEKNYHGSQYEDENSPDRPKRELNNGARFIKDVQQSKNIKEIDIDL